MKFSRLLCFLFLLGGISFQGFGQTQEVGAQVSSLTDINLIYKKQLKKENRYLRLSAVDLGVIVSTNQQAVSFGGNVGWENRRFLNDRFAFVHGWILGFSTNTFVQNDEVNAVISPNLGYLLGFRYNINDQFSVNLEMIPQALFRYNTRNNIGQFLLNANMNQAGVWLVYSFEKKK